MSDALFNEIEACGGGNFSAGVKALALVALAQLSRATDPYHADIYKLLAEPLDPDVAKALRGLVIPTYNHGYTTSPAMPLVPVPGSDMAPQAQNSMLEPPEPEPKPDPFAALGFDF
ncbi:hypothetical protein [Herpetosiphon geysericola]|nr:hypothetical protein [Herpetosiphon geysericola]